jgi:hypothetical protein
MINQLTGRDLDRAVAEALGLVPLFSADHDCLADMVDWLDCQGSTIRIHAVGAARSMRWTAQWSMHQIAPTGPFAEIDGDCEATGSSLLEAVARLIVAVAKRKESKP